WPSVFCQMMSDLPSPLKSPVPITCQVGPELGSTALPVSDVPFMNQITGCPSSLCHRMSVLPSALKSPVAITCQEDVAGLGSATVLVTLVPFISQICGVPSAVCTMMSALLSWLKSPMAWTVQPSGVVIVAEEATVVSLSSSTITLGLPTLGEFCSSRSDLP